MNRFIDVRLEVPDEVAPSSGSELRMAAELIAKAVGEQVRVVEVAYRERSETMSEIFTVAWSIQSGVQDVQRAIADVQARLPELVAATASLNETLRALEPSSAPPQ
jgi:hypothetical protein